MGNKGSELTNRVVYNGLITGLYLRRRCNLSEVRPRWKKSVTGVCPVGTRA